MFSRASAILAAGSIALTATAAGAQEGYGVYYRGSPSVAPEEVIVTAPPVGPQRSRIGAPIENVSLSRTIRMSDLDLRTRWGAHRLRARIFFAATTLCQQLDALYPVTYNGDQWPTNSKCYRNAVDDAMQQADRAISAARSGGTYGGYRER